MKIINELLDVLDEFLNPDNSSNEYGHGLIYVPVPERSELEQRLRDAGRR
ncbi:MAG: hypothetical protein JST75_13105 [Bacteroidetes bacterium]|nr:hypothetical protein [Bacteroidota bacterium]